MGITTKRYQSDTGIQGSIFFVDTICIMVSKQFKYGKYGMVYIIERCGIGMEWYRHISYGL